MQARIPNSGAATNTTSTTPGVEAKDFEQVRINCSVCGINSDVFQMDALNFIMVHTTLPVKNR